MEIKVELWCDGTLGVFDAFVCDIEYLIELYKQYVFEDVEGQEYKFERATLGVVCVTIYLERC